MSGVRQGSVLGPLLLLIYINNLPNGINALKVFADDISFFSKVYDIHKSASKLNDGLEKISVRLISGNCSLIQILPNRLMKLFSVKKQVQINYHINLSNLIRLTFLKAPSKST